MDDDDIICYGSLRAIGIMDKSDPKLPKSIVRLLKPLLNYDGFHFHFGLVRHGDAFSLNVYGSKFYFGFLRRDEVGLHISFACPDTLPPGVPYINPHRCLLTGREQPDESGEVKGGGEEIRLWSVDDVRQMGKGRRLSPKLKRILARGRIIFKRGPRADPWMHSKYGEFHWNPKRLTRKQRRHVRENLR